MSKKIWKKIKNVDESFITMGIYFVIVLILACQIKTLHYVPDELGALSAAAKIMGYDWSGIWNHVHAYYGVAPGILFVPLFLIFKDSVVLYRAILFTVAFISSFSAFFAYKILDVFVRKTQKGYIKIIIALASSFMVGWRVSNVMNEYVLTVSVWAMMYFFIKLVTTQKFLRYWIVEMVWCLVCLLSHTRGIIAVGGFVAAVLFWNIGTRINWEKIIVQIGSFGLVYFLYKILTTFLQETCFYAQKGQPLANTLGNATGQLTADYGVKKLSYTGIRGFLDIFTGNVFALSIVSGGLVIIACVLYCYRVKPLITSLFRGSTSLDEQLSYVWLIPFASFVVSILGFSYINMSFAAIAKVQDVTMSLYMYPRYFSIYLGPMVLFAIISLIVEKDAKKKSCIPTLVTFCLVSLYAFYSFIYHQAKFGGDILDAWRVLYPLNYEQNWRVPMYFNNYLVAFELVVLFIVLIYLSEKKIALYIILFFGIFQFSFTSSVFDKGYTDFVFEQVSSTYYYLSENDIGNSIETIYFDGSYNARSPYALQFLLRDKHIVLAPSETKVMSDCIVFTSRINEDMVIRYGECGKYVMLDKDEYLILVGEENISLFEEAGLEINSFVH